METPEISDQPQKISLQKLEKLILDTLERIGEIGIEEFNLELRRLQDRLEETKKLVDDKKEEIAQAIKNQELHKRIEVLIAEPIQRENSLRQLEVYFALYRSRLFKKQE